MAETTTLEKSNTKIKKSAFGPAKGPDAVIFRLDHQNEKLRPDTDLYPPSIEFPNTDTIVWDFGGDIGERERVIRFLSGEPSIFVDEQEKGGRVIAPQVLNNPKNKFVISQGDIRCQPHEKTKIYFLEICNRNSKSKHRTGRVQPLFSKYSENQRVEDMQERQAKQRRALEKAFTASDEQIVFHAKYFGIPMQDHVTAASRTPEAIKADYQQIAIDDPQRFLDTYDDDDIRLKFYIQKAIDENVISLKIIPGRSVWTENKAELCEIQAGSTDVDSIFNFMRLPMGEKSLKHIMDLNK